MAKPKNKNKNRQANANPLTGQPGFSLPEVSLPPFLMSLLQDGNEFVPRSEGALRAEAAQMASAQTAPGMAQIQSMLQGGKQAIGELTGEIYQRMQPIAGQVRNTYGAAQNQTQGFETAMANRLQAMGLENAAGLQQQYAQAGMPSDTATLAQGVGNEAAAASQASFALGSTALQRLAAEGAAQGAHAAELPGIAQLGGQAALAALTREAAAQSAGIAAQQPGLAMDAYRSLRSSEDARADAANQRRTQLAGMLMDWNQNLQNLAFQTYATDLGFFGDREKAQQGMNEFLAEMGYKYDALKQDQTQFDISEANDLAAAQAGAAEDAAKAHAQGVKNKNTYVGQWERRALSQAQKLFKGEKIEGGGGGYSGSTKDTYKPYTYQQAYRMLTKFLTPGLLQGPEAKRYSLKRKNLDRVVREALEAAGFIKSDVVGGRNRDFGPR